MAVVEEPVEEGGHGGGVSEELAPVVDGAVRGQEGGGALVAPHDHLEEVLGRRVGQSLRMPRSSQMSGGTAARSVK